MKSQKVATDTTGIINDSGDRVIDPQRQAEATLAERNALLQQILDTASVGIALLDQSGRVTLANQRFAELFGYPLDELYGSDYVSLVHPEERETARRNMLALLAGSIPDVDLERFYQRRDGTPFWGHLTCRRLHDAQGRQCGMVGTLADITERKKAEADLSESEARFRQLAESINEVFWLGTPDWGRVLYISPSYRVIWGRAPEDLYADSLLWLESVLAEDRELIRRMIPGLGFSWAGELRFPDYRIMRPDGTIRWISARAYPIRDGAGKVTGVAGIAEDITERKRTEAEKLELERQLIHKHRLESLGVLAGGIAHDFNNLLQGVFGYISMAKMNIDQRDKALAMLEQAEQALSQSVNLSGQLLTFSKGGKPVKKIMPLQPTLETAVRFALSGSQADCVMTIDPDLWMVDMDAGQIGQVIQNLALNAAQAMPLGGRIVFTARNVKVLGSATPATLLSGDYVLLSVEDCGVGMSSEYLERIFDPYFTTKEQGSGLGLAISYSIVRNHGGAISVTSEVGRGSVFSVYLPAAEEAPGVAESLEQEGAEQGLPGRILLMDDELMVRQVAQAMISALGHELVLAERGEEAIERYLEAERQGRPFDVVILDLTIRGGGMGGEETLQRLQAINPKVMAVVSSGYADGAIIANFQTHGFCAALNKPYTLNALGKTLETVLRRCRTV